MKEIRYPVVARNRFCAECYDFGAPDVCLGHEVEVEVDELQRDYPKLFADWVALASDLASWDGRDQMMLDRVALAQAYADPDGAWKRAADAIRLTDLLQEPWDMLAADVESRVPGSVAAALEVLLAVRDLSLELPSEIVGRDLIAIARLRALASVEDIDINEPGIDAEAAQ
jgi:hypothetical protein